MLDVPDAMLDERRRLGLDGRDEMWVGELHMVPPGGGRHQRFGTQLLVVLAPLAEDRGLAPSYETGLFRTDTDYRVPDQLYCRPEDRSERGAEGAELVIEIRSEGDETYDKLDFYAERGVREMLIAYPDDGRFELLRAVGDRLLPVTADREGALRSEVLGAAFTTVAGRLHIAWENDSAEI